MESPVRSLILVDARTLLSITSDKFKKQYGRVTFDSGLEVEARYTKLQLLVGLNEFPSFKFLSKSKRLNVFNDGLATVATSYRFIFELFVGHLITNMPSDGLHKPRLLSIPFSHSFGGVLTLPGCVVVQKGLKIHLLSEFFRDEVVSIR